MKESPQSWATLVLLFRRFTWRHWRRHWKSTALLVGIIALGVGVFLSIRLANRAAVSGFDLFTESISGESDFILRPESGTALPETLPAQIRETLDPLPVAIFPVIEATVAESNEEAASAAPKQIIGADLVALRNAVNLGTGQAAAGFGEQEGNAASSFSLGSSDHAFVSASWAKAKGRESGDSIDLIVDDRKLSLMIAGLLEDDPLRPAVPENLLLMDLPGAQKLLGMDGQINRVEIVIPPGEVADANRAEIFNRLRNASAVPEVIWQLDTPDSRRASAEKMTHAFRMNLTVLSTLALLVGTYLILQALEAAVVRRRSEIAVLRSLGVEPQMIRRLWLVEALTLGTIGGLLGIALGWAMAQLTVGAIARTVNGLYYATTTKAASLHLGEAMAALGFGIAASVVAGWLPARDAASTLPAQSLRAGNRTEGLRLLRRPGLGLILAVISLGCAQLPPWETGTGNRIPIGGYAAALGWLIALSILAGSLFRPVSALVSRMWKMSPEVSYAASQLRRPMGPHRLAVAGLIAAIGMASGMGILVHSFEGTLTGWIRQLLRADLYVATAGMTNAANSNALSLATWQGLATDQSVEGIDVIRRYPIEFRGRQIRLAGSEYNQRSDRWLQLSWLEAPANPDPQALAQLRKGERTPAWVNEAFSRRYAMHRGDEIILPTPVGNRTVVIEAVYADYSDESGTVLVNRVFTSEWFDDDTISNMAVYLKPGIDWGDVQARWKENYPALVIRGNSRLRSEALRVFHQTFAVTYALEAIGVVVAVAGLGLALASLLVERRNEMTTLKSIGFTRAQISRASAIEGASLGGIGFTGGLVLSLILGALLIFVINRQSFGWTLEYRVPWGLLIALGLLTLATSALVSAIIGYRGAQLKGDPQE